MGEKFIDRASMGFCSLLTVLFIGLKLTHYIDWSWWWILSPLWIPVIIVLILVLVLGFITLALELKKDE